MTPRQPHELIELYRAHGELAYDGEGVTQLQHAWQCSQLARDAAATPALQLAAWLHDLGHLLSGLPGSPTLSGIDDGHEVLAAAVLRPLFGAAVAEPIALHVRAKRYLVAVHPGYRERLSPDSLRSLALQGGPMDGDEALTFRQLPHADDALRLRTWDDQSKLPHWRPDTREAALQVLQGLVQQVVADQAAVA